MKTTKHTPGPWVATGGYTPTVIVGETLLCVPSSPADEIGGRHLSELTANACLIAAAPAYALAWSLVPDEIKQRIFDILHNPATEWVEAAITRTTGEK